MSSNKATISKTKGKGKERATAAPVPNATNQHLTNSTLAPPQAPQSTDASPSRRLKPSRSIQDIASTVTGAITSIIPRSINKRGGAAVPAVPRPRELGEPGRSKAESMARSKSDGQQQDRRSDDRNHAGTSQRLQGFAAPAGGRGWVPPTAAQTSNAFESYTPRPIVSSAQRMAELETHLAQNPRQPPPPAQPTSSTAARHRRTESAMARALDVTPHDPPADLQALRPRPGQRIRTTPVNDTASAIPPPRGHQYKPSAFGQQ